MQQTPSQQSVQILDHDRAIACMTDPLRRRVVSALASEGSAASLSRRLSIPRQNLAYHIKKLEQAGLLQHVRDEKKGNCTERIVRATARHYLLAPTAAGDLKPEQLQDRLSANALIAMAAQCIGELAQVSAAAEDQRKRVSTLSLTAEVGFRDQQEKAAFAKALTHAFAEAVARFTPSRHSRERRFKVILGAYPEPPVSSKQDSSGDAL